MRRVLLSSLLGVAVACSPPARAIDTPSIAPVTMGPDASIDATTEAPLDLADYGRDPAYRPPGQAPIVVSTDERAVLDEVVRIGAVLERDIPRKALFAELGKPTNDPGGTRVSFQPSSPHLAVLHAWFGDYDEIEVRFFDPIAVEVLVTRFGAFHDYVVDDREDPEYTSQELNVGGPFVVTVTIKSLAGSKQDLAKDRVKVVYLRRERRK